MMKILLVVMMTIWFSTCNEAVIAVKKTDKPVFIINSGDDMYVHIDYA